MFELKAEKIEATRVPPRRFLSGSRFRKETRKRDGQVLIRISAFKSQVLRPLISARAYHGLRVLVSMTSQAACPNRTLLKAF